MGESARGLTEEHDIAGYDFGSGRVPRSPVGLDELRQLEQSVGWTEEDAEILARFGRLIEPQAEAIGDSWRSSIGAQPHLARWFVGPDGKPDDPYKAKVKKRFVQWVVDVCFRPHDQAWLDYQDEIGKRHTPLKKNRTDGARTPELVPMRYTVAFTAVVLTSIRQFVSHKEIAPEDITRFQDAWTRAVMLHVTLWTRAYTRDGLW